MTGRGRARGRARGAIDSQTTPAESARPGVRPVQPSNSDVQLSAASSVVPGNLNGAGVGRAAQRGAPHGDQRPGAGTVARSTFAQRRRADDEAEFVAFCSRPEHVKDKKGQSGHQIKLLSNYFQVVSSPTIIFYQYHVSFEPQLDNIKNRFEFIRAQEKLFNHCYVFDGAMLFSTAKLDEETVVPVFRESDETNFNMCIKRTAELGPSHPTVLMMLNNTLRRSLPKLGLKLVGRCYFDTKRPTDIPQHRLTIMSGFTTSILHHENSLLLNAEVVHKVLRNDTCLEHIQGVLENSRGRGGNPRDIISRSLIGEIVMTRYNNKTYRVDDIDFNESPRSTFSHNGKEVSFIDYYATEYKIRIRDVNQPLIVSRLKKRDRRPGQNIDHVKLIPELCFMTGLSDDMRKDFKVMKDVAAVTRLEPSRRIDSLMNFMKLLKSDPECQKDFDKWGLRFADQLTSVVARVLDRTTICMANNSVLDYNPQEADWSRSFRSQQLTQPVVINRWLAISTQRDRETLNSCLRELSAVARPLGMKMAPPQICPIPDDRPETFLSALKNYCADDTEFVFICVPNERKDRYDAIKKHLCIDRGVPSQVIKAKTVMNPKSLKSVCTKVAMQINVKMGGILWEVSLPKQMKPTMIVGIDAFHDSAKKKESVGAFVASYNASFTKYWGRCSIQPSLLELQNQLNTMFISALKHFNKVNNTLPGLVIVYRDGVGDGQLQSVFDHEVTQFLEALRKIDPSGSIKMTFIVVTKRIRTRFFVDNRGRCDNPPPGTVIDDVVTRPERYDFYLISQAVRQGSVSPTHYNVIYDESGWVPDRVQRLTYWLSHLYFNWPGTVRTPAPTMYAHKLAFLNGQSLHTEQTHPNLNDKLFYL